MGNPNIRPLTETPSSQAYIQHTWTARQHKLLDNHKVELDLGLQGAGTWAAQRLLSFLCYIFFSAINEE